MSLSKFDQSDASGWDQEAGTPLVIAIFYHDVASASRAVDLVNRVRRNFADELPAKTHLWNFDVLRLDEVARQAALLTAGADLLVVAAHHGDELPGEVKRCLENAVALRDGEEIAIVALLDAAAPHVRSSVCDYLKELCRTTEGCFFSTETLPLDGCPLTPERIHERAEANSSVLDGIMHYRLPQF
ncbi:MAG TPA: hypothetical protein VK530_04765 [Candidatus Acidoferrum sp.]|nr:hypothetical protein [Candidatus Acidoferrum sp.]